MSRTAKYAPREAFDPNDPDGFLYLPATSVTLELTHERELILSGRDDIGSVFPRVKYKGRRWKKESVAALIATGDPRAIRRAEAFDECTRYSRVVVCDCGRPLGGKLGTQHMRCHSRCCPRCGPARARKIRRRIRAWLAADAPPGQWWHIVFTTKYSKYNPDDLTVEAMRGRLDGVRRVWRQWWRKHKGYAALAGAEIGQWGAIHLHVMVCADELPRFPAMLRYYTTKEWRYRAELPTGFVDFAEKPLPDPERSVGQVAKYAAKIPGGENLGSDWWTTPKVCPNPRLIANWELASWGQRLVERYGAARSLPEPEPEPEPDLSEVHCPRCNRTADQGTERRIETAHWAMWAKHLEIDPFGFDKGG